LAVRDLLHSSREAVASTASRATFRDDREAPLVSGAGRRELKPVICPTAQAEYFSREDLTSFLKISMTGKSVLA
jgi:hypothetical protein